MLLETPFSPLQKNNYDDDEKNSNEMLKYIKNEREVVKKKGLGLDQTNAALYKALEKKKYLRFI